MGRMADLLRHAERPRRHRDSEATEPAVVPVPHCDPPTQSDDDLTLANVPFIEVGGSREPAVCLLHPMAEPDAPAVVPPVVQMPLAADDPLPGLIEIRFQPVQAGKVRGRGFGPELVAYHQADHVVSVQYRSLAAEIAAQLPGDQPRVLAFTAAAPEAGTSTVLLNLAVTLARVEGTRVVVVDAHAERPALAERLGLPAAPGLHEVLTRQTPLAWSLQETAQAQLLALTAGKPGGRWDGTGLSGALDLLRGRADWVLVDVGPWHESASAAWAEACDAVYLVHRHQGADSAVAREVQTAILAATGRLRGCVITRR